MVQNHEDTCIVALATACLLAGASAHAQLAAPDYARRVDHDTVSKADEDDIARESENPIGNLTVLPLENYTNFGVGPHDGTQCPPSALMVRSAHHNSPLTDDACGSHQPSFPAPRYRR